MASRKRKCVDIEKKCEIIKALDLGISSKTEIAWQYGLAASTLSSILKLKALLF